MKQIIFYGHEGTANITFRQIANSVAWNEGVIIDGNFIPLAKIQIGELITACRRLKEANYAFDYQIINREGFWKCGKYYTEEYWKEKQQAINRGL